MSPALQRLKLPGRGTERIINCRVLQSPLAGVSDHIFRQLVRRWAPNALLFTEMVNATGLEQGYGTRKVSKLSEEKGPVGVQLFDHRPAAMATAAKKAEDAGAFLVDINMGCPVKKISRKGGGSALLKNPNLAAEIVHKVVNSVQIPVTVKTRLGWSENSSNPVEFARLVESAGAQLLTLHGRTREQGFSGTSNWSEIGKVKKAIRIPLIANGDIKTAAQALHCMAISGADGIMIGRASMSAPWLIGQVDAALKGDNRFKEPCLRDRLKLMIEHLNLLVAEKGDHGLLIARKHMALTCNGFEGSSMLRYSLLRAKTHEEAVALLNSKIKFLSSTNH